MARFAHNLVADTAKAMAGEWYETAAHDNTFYKYYPNRGKFIAREWGRFIGMARRQLALMLGNPKYPESLKDQILDALCLQNTLPKGDHSIAASSPQRIH